MALTVKANFKTYKGITKNDDDTLIDDLIKRASGFIESQCGRKFGEATYTEYYDGDDVRSFPVSRRDKLILENHPVTTFTSLHDDTNGVFGSSTLIATADYDVKMDSGIVVLKAVKFNIGVGNIKAVYDAGYVLPDQASPTLPDEIEHACIELTNWMFEDRGERVGLVSKSILEGGNTTFMQELPILVQRVINTYKRLNV